jgi:hypothetical protein
MAKNKYVFAQRNEDEQSSIKLIEGEYKEIIFNFGTVGFSKEENEKGELDMKFDYTILKNPNNVDTTTDEFINYIGDILVELLEKQIKDGKLDLK